MDQDTVSQFTHDLLVYDSDEDQLAVSLPFVRSGVAAGETVLVDVPAGLRAPFQEMFDDEPRVSVAPDAVSGDPVRAMSRYEDVLRRHPRPDRPGVCALTAWAAPAAGVSWREWIRYESAINRVFAPYPFHNLCLYDARSAPAEVVDGARRAHPRHTGPDGATASRTYLEPEEMLAHDDYRLDADPLQQTVPTVELRNVADLASMRLDVYLATLHTDVPLRRVSDLAAGINEVAGNALRHGRPPVDVRLWADTTRLVCTVTDRGTGIPDPVTGYGRPTGAGAHGALGLWAARQLCDVLDFGVGSDGFTVRMIVRG